MGGRESFPRFLTERRVLNDPELTPISYLNDPRGEGASFAIAAQWLYVPDFVEYRGGLFYSRLPQGLKEGSRRNIDQWISSHEGDISRTERMVNLLTLWDVFGEATGKNLYVEDLSQVAESIARSWRALLKAEFFDRTYQVDVYDDDDSYGPQITFYSVDRQNPQP